MKMKVLLRTLVRLKQKIRVYAYSLRNKRPDADMMSIQNASHEDVVLMLDAHIEKHVDFNAAFIDYYVGAFGHWPLVVVAPGLVEMENMAYTIDPKRLFDFDVIIATAKHQELLACVNYYERGLSRIVCLIGDADQGRLLDIFNKVNLLDERELCDYIEDGLYYGSGVKIDLSLVLKSSSRDTEDFLQSQFYRLVIFYMMVVVDFLDGCRVASGVLFQNSVYSVNYIVQQYLRIHRPSARLRYFLPVFRGHDCSSFKVCENPSVDNFLRRRLASNYLRADLILDALSFVQTHFDVNVFGSSPFKYSPDSGPLKKTDIWSLLGLDEGVRINIYFTSSPDEEVASDVLFGGLFDETAFKRSPFDDEVKAIHALLEMVTAKDEYLIVRFHPRLASESRVPRESDQYAGFYNAVSSCQRDAPRLIIVDASSDVSSYWLAGWADMIFSLRSSMAFVLPLMGLPVTLLSDNRGENVANFDSLKINAASDLITCLNGEAVSLARLLDLVYGFYVTNFYASFSPIGASLDDELYAFRRSVDSGYSSLARLPNLSEDLIEDGCPIMAINEVNKYLMYLSFRVDELSSKSYYPLKRRIASLMVELNEVSSSASAHEINV